MAAKYQKEVTMEAKTTDGCVVCCSVCEIFAFGACDHCVCYECSTRMRVLCEQNECPICRQELAQVLFVGKVQKFADVRWSNWPIVDRRYNIYFETEAIKRAFEKLLEYVCNLCGAVVRSLDQLSKHMRKEHDRHFCDLCVDSLKIFSFEYKSYSRADLVQHRRKGEENTSHRGHPLCEFCEERYLDSDELFRHLRKDHFFCHFCDADGIQEFFIDYTDLRQHFLENHYLCEEGSCRDEQYTSAFRTDIDWKAHKASVHNKNMTKAQVKQARTLELEFPFPRRSQQQSSRGGAPINDGLHFTRYNHGRKFETEDHSAPDSAVAGVHSEVTQPTPAPSIYSRQDFPSLDAKTTESHQLNFKPNSFAQRIGRISHYTAGDEGQSQFAEDFPSLGGIPNRAPSLQGQWNTSQGRNTTTAMAKSSTAIAPPKMKNNSVYLQLTNSDFPSLPPGPSNNRSHNLATNHITAKVQNASSASNVKKDISTKKPVRVLPISSSSALKSTTTTTTSSSSGYKRAQFCDDDFPQLAKDSFDDDTESWAMFGGKNLRQKVPTVGKGAGKKRGDGNEKKSSSSSSVHVPVQNKYLSLQGVADSLLGYTSTSNHRKEPKGGKNSTNKVMTTEQVSKIKTFTKVDTEQNCLASKPLVQNGKHKDTFDQNEKEKPSKSNVQKDKNSNVYDMKHLDVYMDDFPELPQRANKSVNNNKTSNIPPPGFNSAATNSSKPPPPGFNATNSKSDTFCNKREGMIATGFSFHQYHEPDNFKERNQALINKAQDIVGGDQIHFGAFKSLSGQFRKGVLSASEYYEQCLNLLGDEFFSIFPELLVLLPDISKQKELLSVHNIHQRDVNENTKGTQFLVCATCQQVLASVDFKKHKDTHELDNKFPTLSNSASIAK